MEQKSTSHVGPLRGDYANSIHLCLAPGEHVRVMDTPTGEGIETLHAGVDAPGEHFLAQGVLQGPCIRPSNPCHFPPRGFE